MWYNIICCKPSFKGEVMRIALIKGLPFAVGFGFCLLFLGGCASRGWYREVYVPQAVEVTASAKAEVKAVPPAKQGAQLRLHSCDKPNWSDPEEWVREAPQSSRVTVDRDVRAEKVPDRHYYDSDGECWYYLRGSARYQGSR